MPNKSLTNLFDNPFNNSFNYYSHYVPYSGCRYVLKRDIALPANSLQELWKATKSTPTPTKIIRSGPVTVIFWEDGTNTLVRRTEGAEDDPYLAFCAGLAKKIYGNNSKVKKLIEEKTVETKEKEKKAND